MALLEATVEGLAMDMTTNSPVVILSPIGVDKVLPIWIGHAEAWSIAMQLSGVTSKRPLTYDLLKRIIEAVEARVDRVEITELHEQTYYALIRLKAPNNLIEIDARPSDSIALALKTEAKIYLNEELLNPEIGDIDASLGAPLPTDPESLRERLKRINPEDFGKYSL